MSRTSARIAAFEKIYQDLMNDTAEEAAGDFHTQVDGDDAEYSALLVDGVRACKEDLEQEIAKFVIGYDIGRVYKVDLAILLLASYEIKNAAKLSAAFPNSAVNKAIACNEAVNLAKKYSTVKSPSFINGVLSKID